MIGRSLAISSLGATQLIFQRFGRERSKNFKTNLASLEKQPVDPRKD
jgi:hypothetical protein